MAEFKPLLKQVRKFINENDYRRAEVICNKILIKDKTNYYALVFLGKVLEGAVRARVCFKIAIAFKPKRSLAWRGLANYYESYQDSAPTSELIVIYRELLQMKIEREKTVDIIIKVAKIGYFSKDIKLIRILMNYLDKDPAHKLYILNRGYLLENLKSDMHCDDKTLTIESYLARKILEGSMYSSLCILLGKIILDKNKIREGFEEITRLPFFSTNAVFRNWTCKFLCKTFVENETFNPIDINKYYKSVTIGIKKSKYAKLLSSIILYCNKLYIEAYTECLGLINFDNYTLIEAVHLLRCATMLGKWMIAEKLALRFLMYTKNVDYMIKIRKVLFLALVQQKKWSSAIHVANEIPFDSLLVSERALLAKSYIENMQIENGRHILKYLEDTEYYVPFQGLILMKQEKYIDAITVLHTVEENAMTVFYIAKCYWALRDFKTCNMFILKSVIRDSKCADAYLLWGEYLIEIKNNIKVGRRFLEKAYLLNNGDINIIKKLSDFYLETNLPEENYRLLINSSVYVLDQPWLYFRIAVHHIELREWENAIDYLIKTIRCDDKYLDAYEYLAESFLAYEHFKCALKIFYTAIKLNPQKRLYFLARIAWVYTEMKNFDRAIMMFEDVLEIEPLNIMALAGITNAWMRVARIQESAKIYHLARDAAQTAINYLTVALSRTGKLMGLWKLLANAILYIVRLPDDYCFVKLHFNDASRDIGRLGTLYIKTSMYKMIYYCFWRGQSILPREVEVLISNEVSSDIFDEEESADLFRYSCAPDHGMIYSAWVTNMLREDDPSSWESL